MLTPEKYRELADVKDETCVSIFIPTYRAGKAEEDKIRLKNALKEAEQQLAEKHEMPERQAEKYLAKGYELLDRSDFWKNLSDGLAIFLSADRFHTEIVPLDFDPHVSVGPTYRLYPLLPLLTDTSQFHILALSQNEIKMYAADRYTIQEVCIDDLVPEDMDAALMYDDPGKHVQHHSGRGGNEAAIFHGQGMGKDVFKQELKEYFDRVNDGIQAYMNTQNNPLLIACVDYEFPVYKEANTYQHLITDTHVGGNVLEDDPVLIHEKSWPLVEEMMNSQQARDKDLFGDNLAQGEASFSHIDIVPAAINGRVAVLFVDKNKELTGQYEIATNAVTLDDTGEDLLERAALATYEAGGRVYLLDTEDMPRPTAALNAIFRY